MLLVRTKVKPSELHGVGTFADQFIPKDTVVWEYDPRVDKTFSKEQALAFPKEVYPFLHQSLWQSVWKDRRGRYFYVLDGDNALYINHSIQPNLVQVCEDSRYIEHVEIADRDIQPGEELTLNYLNFKIDTSPGNLHELLAELGDVSSTTFQDMIEGRV